MLISKTSKSFAVLPEADKCELLDTLSRIPCAIAGSLQKRFARCPSETGMLLCEVCDSEDRGNDVSSDVLCSNFDSLREVLVSILPQLSRASGPRIAAMIALRRLLMHDSGSSRMQLASSVFGEFCLNSLRSSIRELRVVTGYV